MDDLAQRYVVTGAVFSGAQNCETSYSALLSHSKQELDSVLGTDNFWRRE